MTDTTKGAVGAETKTAEDIDRAIVAALAGINIVEAAEEYEFYADEGSHTPTDFERCLLIDFAHGLMSDIHKAVRPLVAATSAPTPFVPDSLRALSEAAEAEHSSRVDRVRAEGAFLKAAAKWVRTLLSTHPAGQNEDAEPCIACGKLLKAGERVLSDASGGTVHAACCGPERESYTDADGEPLGPNDPIPQGYVYEPDHPAGQSAGMGAERDQVDAGLIQMLIADNARMRAAGTKLSEASLRVIREYDGTHRLSLAVTEWAKAIADEGGRADRFKPAPDSTRTEGEGAEEALAEAYLRGASWWQRSGYSISDPEGQALIRKAASDYADLHARARAALPAAPEAQGAQGAEPPWKPIAEAKHDGTVYLLGLYDGPEKTDENWCAVEGWYEAGINDRCWYDVFNERVEPAYFRERIAPPASSGQGGR